MRRSRRSAALSTEPERVHDRMPGLRYDRGECVPKRVDRSWPADGSSTMRLPFPCSVERQREREAAKLCKT
jgi:hypothetical protein